MSPPHDSPHDGPDFGSSLPPTPTPRKPRKRLEPLAEHEYASVKALEELRDAFDAALAEALRTGEPSKAIALYTKIFTTAKTFLDDPSNQVLVKEMSERFRMNRRKREDEAFAHRLERAERLRGFVENVTGGEAAPPEVAFKILALVGIDESGGGGDAPGFLEQAIELGKTTMLQHALKGRAGGAGGDAVARPAPAPRPYGIPDGAVINEANIDSTVIMQALVFLAEKGLIDEDGFLDEALWGSVSTLREAQEATRR